MILAMSRKPDLHAGSPPLPAGHIEQAQAAMEKVLGSHLFRGSRRCQILLRYIVGQTLTGDAGSLKERTLGVEVFGRNPDYDTSQDPIVRASAAEIRKKLAQYYQEPGHQDDVRIGLIPGSYVAEFHFDQTNGNGHPLPPAAPVISEPLRHPARKRFLVIAACALSLGVLAAVVLLALPPAGHTALDQLWAPVLKAPGAVLISVGQPVAYNLKSAELQDAVQGFGPAQPPLGHPAHRPILEDDLVILWDRYVALGDAVCLVHLTSLLEHYGKPYHVRGERSTSFADLRDTPSVLIAAFDNPWTLRTAGQLRFTFGKDSASETDLVVDSEHPENREWKLTGAWPNWDIPVDYAIVSRILDTTSDRPVIIAAGITQYGTLAAGEFLSNAAYFAEAARQLPPHWQKKNLQIVLRVPVVNHIPGRPRILATHVW